MRVKRTQSNYALYTVSEVRHEDTEEIVRIGQRGRLRLGTEEENHEEFDAEFDSRVVNPTMSDEKAKENGEFIERLHDDGAHTGLIVIAPHGGLIEKHTDDQARGVASRLADKAVSFWLCKGYHPQGAYDAWHITSVDIHPGSFPLLNVLFSRRFSDAVAFHGVKPDEGAQTDVLVGGMASPELKAQIALKIQDAVGASISVRVARPDDRFNGHDPPQHRQPAHHRGSQRRPDRTKRLGPRSAALRQDRRSGLERLSVPDALTPKGTDHFRRRNVSLFIDVQVTRAKKVVARSLGAGPHEGVPARGA